MKKKIGIFKFPHQPKKICINVMLRNADSLISRKLSFSLCSFQAKVNRKYHDNIGQAERSVKWSAFL